MAGKAHGLCIDHVGNVLNPAIGLPDRHIDWSLEDTERRKKTESDALALRVCEACSAVFERVAKVCPHCGTKVTPAARTGPEFVDGDLTELDEATLAALRGLVAKVDREPRVPAGAAPVVVASIKKNHAERQRVQRVLRDQIAQWAGIERHLGRPDDESYRRFYLTFGVDVLTAQSLGARDAGGLAERVRDDVARKLLSF
jgi:hypothetical protein